VQVLKSDLGESTCFDERLRIRLGSPPLMSSDLDSPLNDSRMAELLENIEREETAERLLKLARELQQRLLMMKQREKPN
jgi:hypothetical protein